MNWQVIDTEYLVKHPPYFIARKDVCKKPDGTIIPSYYVVELPPSVLVFAMPDDEQVIMIKQFRHPVNEISLELPGGFVDAGETPLQAAQREVLEETGYTFASYEWLGKVAANPGVLNNFTDMFLARNVISKTGQSLESTEEITVAHYTIEEVFSLLNSNGIIQSLHVNGCFHALLHLKKLRFEDK